MASINPEKALALFIILCMVMGVAINLYLLAIYPRTREIIVEHLGEDWFTTFKINPTPQQTRAMLVGAAAGVAIGAGVDVAQPVWSYF